MQEEVPDACRLDPGDVGGGAGEHAGLVLNGAADGPEAHHAVHLPAVPPQLAQQRATRVALEEQEGKNTAAALVIDSTGRPAEGRLTQIPVLPGMQQVDPLYL